MLGDAKGRFRQTLPDLREDQCFKLERKNAVLLRKGINRTEFEYQLQNYSGIKCVWIQQCSSLTYHAAVNGSENGATAAFRPEELARLSTGIVFQQIGPDSAQTGNASDSEWKDGGLNICGTYDLQELFGEDTTLTTNEEFVVCRLCAIEVSSENLEHHSTVCITVRQHLQNLREVNARLKKVRQRCQDIEEHMLKFFVDRVDQVLIAE